MFNKIEIPSSWKEEYTKYPNGKTIWEALSAAMTSFNDFVDEVNADVQEGLLSIDQAEETLRADLNTAFIALEDAYALSFSALQDEVDAAVASVADKVTQDQLNTVNAQLAEKVQNFKLISLLGKHDTKDSILNYVVGGNLFFTTNNGISAIPRKKINLIANRKYYVYTKWAENTNNFTTFFRAYDGAVIPVGTMLGTTVNNGLVSSLTFISPNTDSVSVAYRNGIADSNYYHDYSLIFDLTEIFGAGNEPERAEMDKLMQLLNGWNVGELMLTQKQYNNWHLALMRQNRNAIIALGGTII